MKKTYRYELNLSKEETENILKEMAQINKIFVDFRKDEILIMNVYKVLNQIPVRGQIGFVGRIYTDFSKTIINGRFDAPSVFYKTVIIVYAITWLLFLMLSGTYKNILLNTILFSTSCYLLTKVYIKLSICLFNKQNKSVLKFLELMEKDYKKC